MTLKSLPKIIVAAITLTMVVGLCSSALADDVLSKIKKEGKLVVGTSADYPPYESVDIAGKFVGFDMDLVREIGKRMGVEVVIKDMGFDTLITALQAKKINAVVAAMQYSPERDEKVDFSDVYRKISDAFLVKSDSAIELKAATDIAAYKVGAQTGTIQEKWMHTNLVDTGKMKKNQAFSYERVDNAAMDVAAGRIDVLFIQSDPAAKLIEKGKLKIALVSTETVVAGQCIAIPEGEKTLQAELNKYIAEMKADGTMAKITAKHGLK
jgi:polar amino acid transport system substrate-binding protein